VQIALVLLPEGVALFIGDQEAGIGFGDRFRIRIEALESSCIVRWLQQAPPRRTVALSKRLAQIRYTTVNCFESFNVLLDLGPAREPIFARDRK
jgi:hypothetical protein